MRWESDEITKSLSRVVVSEGNSRVRADSFASGSHEKNIGCFMFTSARWVVYHKPTSSVMVNSVLSRWATRRYRPTDRARNAGLTHNPWRRQSINQAVS